MKDTLIKDTLIAVVFFMVLTGVLIWANYRDEQLTRAMDEYDECVKRETGMTAMRFQQQSGYLLDCK